MGRITVNLSSQAGGEDWRPIRLHRSEQSDHTADLVKEWRAELVFGKSNLIFIPAAADGVLRIHPDATGLSVGGVVEVMLI